MIIPIEVQVPQALQISPEMLTEALTRYAQGYVDGLANRKMQNEPTYSIEELLDEAEESVREFQAGEYISAEESNRLMDAHIAHNYAHAI